MLNSALLLEQWQRWAGLLVPFSLLMLIGVVYFQFHTAPAVDRVLTGVVAAAAGMALSMGFKILHVYWRDSLALGLAALTFVLLEFKGIGLIPVVLVLGPITMALSRGSNTMVDPSAWDTWLRVVWTFLRLSLFSLGGGNTLLANITTSRWSASAVAAPSSRYALAEAA